MKYIVTDDNVICKGKWAKTKKGAIKQSVEKWQAIVDYLEKNKKDLGPNVGCGQCSLCQLFNMSKQGELIDPDCMKCPIGIKTGEYDCDKTPYADYMDAYTPKQRLKFARAEVAFLESLK